MPADTLISVDHVSKKFSRSLKRSLWYGLNDLGSDLIGKRRDRSRLRSSEFWALRDISFEVRQGDSVGLIGRNGAGKTTLLKLLNGLMKPDEGRIEVKGRMQALIALGAGFNPILTGRENVYINGAVLGIPKSEIDRRFDEIVAFSGVEEFIDAPVQSYSSGMIVRLGFSVAVHMEPDILLVDEVLAVGDIPFRSKCHRKLGELKEKGIPWIMVSHDMGIIRNQTNIGVFLEKGAIKFIGSPEDAIAQYLYSISEHEYIKNSNHQKLELTESTSQQARIIQVRLLDDHEDEKEYFLTGEPLLVEIEYEAFERIEKPSFGVHIYSVQDESLITGVSTAISDYQIESISGKGKITYRMEGLPLLPGIFRVRADIWDKRMGMLDKRTEAAYLHVKKGAFSMGMIYIPHTWKVDSHEYSY
jgi:lipopolysaccharide transport system ATP-binding protein